MEIISAKYVVPVDQSVIIGGAIAVEKSEIIDVGLEADLIKRYPSATIENFPRHAILPGLINAHTHLDMFLHRDYANDPVRTMGAQTNFVEWLIEGIDYKRHKSQEKLKEAVELAVADCVESGTTCVAEMGNYEGIFQVLEQVGMRGVIFPEVLSYDSSVARDLYEAALAIVEKYMEFESPRLSVGMGPYSTYTISRNILKILSQYCRSSNIPLMIHVSESFSEMEFFFDSSGDIATNLFPNIGWGENLPPQFRKSPIEYLEGIDFLAARPLLVGCVQATTKDIALLEKTKANVVWCPRSVNYRNLGKTPVGTFHKKGINLCLGTDGISSVNNLSLWDEMRFAFEQAKAQGISAEELFKMATINPAIALNLQSDVGSLTSGKKADYIVVDTKEHKDGEDFYSNLILHTRNYSVHKVVVDGRTLKMIN